MPIRINVNLFPKDGYMFKEQDSSVIRGGSWKTVILKVIAYRQRAKLPPGDPVNEVMAQACQRNPSYCHETNRTAPAPRITAKARALKWLNEIQKLPKEELEFVGPEVARQRAEICAKCPLNTPLGVSSCSSCKQTFSSFRKLILGSARVRDGRLGGCAVLGADLTTAAHLDEIRVDNSALPANCWRKTTI